MEIFFPDVADNGDRGLTLEAGTVAVCAKATEGTTFTDPSFAGFRSQANGIGAFFTAYHWLWPGNVQAQAQHCFNVVGPDVEVMLDVEELQAVPTVADITTFVSWFRRLGGLCNELYLPHWYWRDHMGSPDLTPCKAMGLLLVVSEYRAYDANNWPGGYGGMAPYRWQYTDAFDYNGHPTDFNAVRGTIDEYRAAVGPVRPTPPPPPQKGDDLVDHWTTVKQGDKGDRVRIAQGLLVANGYPVGSPNGLPDGDFGPTTDRSTRQLQEAKGITVDGEFGPHTASMALYSHDYA